MPVVRLSPAVVEQIKRHAIYYWDDSDASYNLDNSMNIVVDDDVAFSLGDDPENKLRKLFNMPPAPRH